MIGRTRIDDWAKTVLSLDSTFKETIALISDTGYQVGLICSVDGRLVGVVTDGDIRRALLRGLSLDESVAGVMNCAPLIVNECLGEKEASEIMSMNHIFHLPVVNESGHLTGLHVAEHLLNNNALAETLVIMAGGRGQRLMPLTADTPKPMLPVEGKPILEHIINKAKASGFKRICISVNYLADHITDYFGNGKRFGVEIEYLKEDFPLGTAGALQLLPQEITGSRIVVINGDILTDVCYGELLRFSKATNSDGVMAVRIQEWTNPFGVVKTEGSRLVELQEKPTNRYQVNAGIYVLGEKVLKLLNKDEYCDMTVLFERSIESGLEMNVFALHESWIDVGNPNDYSRIASVI